LLIDFCERLLELHGSMRYLQ